jgi:putative ABC transport system ATP-binding protein
MAFIDLVDVCKSYTIGEYMVMAVDGVSTQFDKRDFVLIKGTSGAGKTTLLNLLASFDKPTSGSIIVDGINTVLLKEDALASWRATSIGFVFQAFNLISTLTGRENILFPVLCWEPESPDIHAKVDNLLDMVGMADRADHLPMQLSAGEQQRIAIARALINEPSTIIADEPTANLDRKTATCILDIFDRIAKQGGVETMIVASHDDRFDELATRRFIMDTGHLTES